MPPRPLLSSWTCAAAALIAGAALMLAAPHAAWADPNARTAPGATTTAERMAALYAPQFNFTREGEPLVYAGIMDGGDHVELSSRYPFRVLRIGEDGVAEEFDGGRRTEIRLVHGSPGTYRHWVVVQRFSQEHKDLTQQTVDAWVDRGYLPKIIEVGGLFAIGARSFDSRAVLVAVGGFEDESDARRLSERLRRRFGVQAEFHREIITYPSGMLAARNSRQQTTRRDLLWLAPTRADQTFRFKAPGGERTYAGNLAFTVSSGGELSAINVVPTETLLKGVVPSEVYPSAHIEALKAQAIAARGEVLSALGVRHIADPYMLCSSVHCQVYTGLTREHARTNQAVEQTRGELMFHKETWERQWHIVDARYSANCGGFSENKEHVWKGEPHSYLKGHGDMDHVPPAFRKGIDDGNINAWLRARPKTWCNTDRYGANKSFRWTRSVDVATLKAKLKARGFDDVGVVQKVELLERGVSGRVTRLYIRGSRGEAVLDSELAIRRAFGGLRSAMFTLKTDTDRDGYPVRFHFTGGGFGHGVGMCQTGAMMMAQSGRSYRDILTHYYRGVQIEKVY